MHSTINLDIYWQGRMDAKRMRPLKLKCKPGFVQRGAACQRPRSKKAIAAGLLTAAIAGAGAAAIARQQMKNRNLATAKSIESTQQATTLSTSSINNKNKAKIIAGAITTGVAGGVIAKRNSSKNKVLSTPPNAKTDPQPISKKTTVTSLQKAQETQETEQLKIDQRKQARKSQLDKALANNPNGTHPPALDANKIDLQKYSEQLEQFKKANQYSYGKDYQGDYMLKKLSDDQGFGEKPHVVSSDDLDKYIADGEIELYRGIDEENGNERGVQFQKGDFFAGKGVLGNGTYTAVAGKKTARSAKAVANLYAGRDTSGNQKQGSVIRMSVKKDAKIVDYDELIKEMESQEELPIAFKDPGRYATLKGYDAIKKINGEKEPDYMVILNRTALRVQDEIF